MTREHVETLNLRMPIDLKARVNAAARRAGISANRFIIQTLTDKLNNQEMTDEIRDLKERIIRLEQEVFGD